MASEAERKGTSFRVALRLLNDIAQARVAKELADKQIESLARVLDEIITDFPEGDRLEFINRLNELRYMQYKDVKSDNIRNKVIDLMIISKEKPLSILEIKTALKQSGDSPDMKQLYNTVHYLEKSGFLRRIARGYYQLSSGAGITGLDIDRDDGTHWISEND